MPAKNYQDALRSTTSTVTYREGGSIKLPKAKGGGSCGSKTRMKKLLKKRR